MKVVKKLSILIIVILLISGIIYLLSILKKDYDIYQASQYEVYNSYIFNGLVICDDSIIDAKKDASCQYYVNDGDKIRKGTVIAARNPKTVNDSSALLINNDLNNKLDKISYHEKDTYDDGIVLNRDIIKKSHLLLAKNIVSQNFYSFYYNYNTFLKAYYEFNRSALGSSSENKSDNSSFSNVESPIDGYFSSYSDNFPDIYQEIEKYTFSDMEQLFLIDYVQDKNQIGKIVKNYVWYLLIQIPSGQEAGLKINQTVSVDFIGFDESSVGKIINLYSDEECSYLLIRSSEINDVVVSNRNCVVRLSTPTYIGLRLEKKDLHAIENEQGVYIDNGYNVQFKKVSIIYEGEDYYLSDINPPDGSYLELYDNIISTDSVLYDGLKMENI